MFHLNDLQENDLDCPKVHQTHGLREGTVLFETQMAALWTSTVWGLLKGQLKSISRWSNHVRPPLKIPNVLGRPPKMSVHIYLYIYIYLQKGMGSPSYSLYDFNFGGISLQETSLPLQIYMCHGQKLRFFLDGHPTFNVGILIMGPYKPLRTWVDFSHRLLYGNNGS